MTERSEILEMLARLQLSGMRATYDEIVTMSIKRQERGAGNRCIAQSRDHGQAAAIHQLPTACRQTAARQGTRRAQAAASSTTRATASSSAEPARGKPHLLANGTPLIESLSLNQGA